MNYRSAVAEAKRLVKRSEEAQWRLAELTAEVIASGVTTRQWASDVGWKSGTSAAYYRRIWERWSDVHQGERPSFQDAWAQAMSGDESITNAERKRLDEERRVPTGHGDKVEMARKLLAEPDVAEDVIREPKVRASVVRASQSVDEEAASEAKTRERQRAPRMTNRAVQYEIIGQLTSTRYALNRVLDRLRDLDLDDEARESILEVLGEVENSAGWIRSFLESGDRSFDRALDRLLREGKDR